MTKGFSQYATIDAGVHFNDTIGNLSLQVLYQGIFIFLTVAVVMFGIQNGIERLSKVMMPLLFGIIVILVIYSLTLDGLGEAISFLFKPEALEEGTSFTSIFASALGQAFFSLSLGMGAVITYARAVDEKQNINVITLQVAVCDTLIALLAGLAIFPIIFTYGMDPAGGAGLAFMSLPVAFSEMPMGYVFGNLFFLLLVVAALTSSISMLENTLTLILEKVNINRKVATIGLGVVVLVFGLLSQPAMEYVSPVLSFTGAESFIDQLDLFTMIYLIPIGALIFILCVGYKMDEEVVRKQINNEKVANIFIPYVKYVAPVLVIIILVAGLR